MANERDVRGAAEAAGIRVDTYSPGDGVTRYRFDYEQDDYFAMRGVYTAQGAREALTWLAGYVEGTRRAGDRTARPEMPPESAF